MKILAIETAGNKSSVAICENNKIQAATFSAETSRSAENIIKIIDWVLQESNSSLEEVNYLACSRGPGSFTGIRIALATMLGINIACNIPTITVNNLELIRHRITTQISNHDFYITIINAHRGQTYLAIYDNYLQEISTPQICSNEEIIPMILKFTTEGKVAIAGSGLSNFFTKLQNQNNITILPRFPNPDARIVCQEAFRQLHSNADSIITELKPLYIRPPDAKVIPTSVLK